MTQISLCFRMRLKGLPLNNAYIELTRLSALVRSTGSLHVSKVRAFSIWFSLQDLINVNAAQRRKLETANNVNNVSLKKLP